MPLFYTVLYVLNKMYVEHPTFFKCFACFTLKTMQFTELLVSLLNSIFYTCLIQLSSVQGHVWSHSMKKARGAVIYFCRCRDILSWHNNPIDYPCSVNKKYLCNDSTKFNSFIFKIAAIVIEPHYFNVILFLMSKI